MFPVLPHTYPYIHMSKYISLRTTPPRKMLRSIVVFLTVMRSIAFRVCMGVFDRDFTENEAEDKKERKANANRTKVFGCRKSDTHMRKWTMQVAVASVAKSRALLTHCFVQLYLIDYLL